MRAKYNSFQWLNWIPSSDFTNPCGGFVLCVSEGPSKFSPWSVFSFNQQKVSHKSVNKALKREKWVFTQFTVWLLWGREKDSRNKFWQGDSNDDSLQPLLCLQGGQESTPVLSLLNDWQHNPLSPSLDSSHRLLLKTSQSILISWT